MYQWQSRACLHSLERRSWCQVNTSRPHSPLNPLPPSPTTVQTQAKIERLQDKNKKKKEEIKQLRTQQVSYSALLFLALFDIS